MDIYSDLPSTLTAPARDAAAVTPNDGTDLPHLPRALYVGQGGNLALQMAGGQSVVLAAVPAGSLLPLRPARVLATGTTAGSLVALW
ncbi:MAG: hypothetical protein RLZZ528_299 [Pseudomonadota bacterium]|jgi:hypothetical protein